MNGITSVYVIAAALAGAACQGSGTAVPSSAPREVLSLRLESSHFRLWADGVASSTLRGIAERLEAELPRISADLTVTSLPVTTVEVWTDRESFYVDMQASIGRRHDGATGYVVGPTYVTILDGPNAAGRASHELAHCVSLRLNPTITNNPRWLWETVATYENSDKVDPRTLPYLQTGAYPTLAQLNGDFDTTRQIYEVGFLLGEFIVADWGGDGLVRLVLANGDVQRALGTSTPEFEARWASFVRAKYFAP